MIGCSTFVSNIFVRPGGCEIPLYQCCTHDFLWKGLIDHLPVPFILLYHLAAEMERSNTIIQCNDKDS